MTGLHLEYTVLLVLSMLMNISDAVDSVFLTLHLRGVSRRLF